MTEKKGYTRENSFIGLAPLVLFLSSYLPLFLLIIVRQCISNVAYIHWGGICLESVFNLIKYFGVSITCTFLVILGVYGSFITLKKLDEKAENGTVVRITEVSSINDEPLAYMATYIIPILFQDYSNLTDCLTLFVTFYVVYKLYVRSRLILVNPILNLKYSIYNIKYIDGKIERQGILISKDNSIYEEDKVKLYNVGYQLFYGYIRKNI